MLCTTGRILQPDNINYKFMKKIVQVARIGIVAIMCLVGTGFATAAISSETMQQDEPTRRLVSGTVTDGSGQPVAGASVTLRGASNVGTTTDARGRYSITVARGATLEFSFVGMATQAVSVGNRSNINVRLEEEGLVADEIVITGVFDRPKEAFTGAANSISKEQLQASSSQGLISSIANIDPSFKYIANNDFGSDPNKLNQANITMRGGTALMDYQNDYSNAVAANRPIFVIDGFISSIDQFIALDPSRVENVTTLKDAAATALYGTSAANGVVVVTTVQPKEGKIQAIYSGNFALEIPDLSSYNLMDGNEKLQFELESGLYDSETPLQDLQYKNLYYSRKMDVARGINTDWLGFPLRTALSHRNSLTLSGGEGAIRYSLDLSNDRKTNVMKKSFRNTFNGGVYLNYQLNNLKFSNRLSVTNVYGPNTPYGNFSDYTKMNAYLRPYDENGQPIKIMDENTYTSLGRGQGDTPALGDSEAVKNSSRNPLFNAQLPYLNEVRYLTVRDDFNAEWQINEFLKANGMFSITHTSQRQDTYTDSEHTSFDDYSAADAARKGKYTYRPDTSSSYDAQLKLNYSRFLTDIHYINVGLTGHFSQRKSEWLLFKGEGVPMPFFPSANAYERDSSPEGGDSFDRSMDLAMFFNYMYDSRYIAEATGRVDGSSQYGSNQKSSYTASLGLGWNIDKEQFMLDQNIFSRAKLRASFGRVGSAGSFNVYDALRLYEYTNDSYRGKAAWTISSLGNPDLRSQVTDKFNVGFDLNFLNDRYTVVFDWYNEVTQDLIVPINLPSSAGIATYKANIGKVRNRGWELQLSTKIIENRERRLYWTVTGRASQNRNKILEIGDFLKAYNKKILNDNQRNAAFLYEEGESMNTNFAVESKGIDPATGKEIFIDINGNETFEWSNDDRRPFGVAEAILWGSIDTSVRWKDFTFSAMFYFTTGAEKENRALLTKVENILPYNNADRRALYDRWRQPGDVVSFKGLKEYRNETRNTSRFLAKENVFRNTSLVVKYTVPAAWAKRNLGAEFFEVQAQTEDLLYLTSFEDERGISNPFSRNVSMTIRLTF